jgi:hypothetical protein
VAGRSGCRRAAGAVRSSAHDPGAGAEYARADGLERVIVAPSTPLGIEALPVSEAQPLLAAFHAGVLELGAPFGLSAGGSFTFGPADIHRVSHAGTQPAVTLHAYSPPLWRMGSYEVLPTGELRRWSLSSAEELRPIGA